MSNKTFTYPLPIVLGDAAFPESQERADRCAAAIRAALDEAAKVSRDTRDGDVDIHTAEVVAARIEALKG